VESRPNDVQAIVYKTDLLDLLHGARVLGGIEILLLLDVDSVIAEPLPSFVSKI
jgi:hypothetical protein